eukprot:CAMPEP_0172628828 /NCGR_PEP_ID=MMETSP1068-20121228/164110_1 /TAXON_ID=35684 /ORGANISM="Pseudopedinella elastica, Strain CCMP716" /LENGTH=229 /DNA_ID=CAMNT_0013439183 /DNA_START=310 /DNA_END=996 /DNA_ORIENTATION=-
MANLDALREGNPEGAKELVDTCEYMVQLCSVGDLLSLRQGCATVLAIEAWAQPPPLWYVARMVRAAAAAAQIGCLRWLVQGGGASPRVLPPLKDLLHAAVKTCLPSDPEGLQRTLWTLTGLVSGGFDVNTPRPLDGWTPLHVACSRNLFAVARHLVHLGADVNAVGRYDDAVPLLLADRVAAMLLRPKANKPAGSLAIEFDDEDDDGEEAEAEPKTAAPVAQAPEAAPE